MGLWLPHHCMEIQPVHSKGDQPWVFFGRNDATAEPPVLWPPHEKNWLIGKDSDAGRYWGQEEKGTTENEMAGWHHRLDGCEFEWTPGVGDGQGGLVCCDSWGCKESDMAEWLELNHLLPIIGFFLFVFFLASLVVQRVKHLPAVWETKVQSLGREDPLEKEMATYSSILAWGIPWTEGPARLQSTGSQRVGHDWATSLLSSTSLEKEASNFFSPLTANF